MATLYIVATPIGNLEDISLRALRILGEVDFILCEDTRTTKVLLDHYQLTTPTISYHQHTDEQKTNKIIELLANGKNLALVSEAGTPGISDPGGKLIQKVIEKFGVGTMHTSPVGAQNMVPVQIESVPGPSAITAALSISGIPTDKFVFMGFPPHKKGRQTFIKKILVSEYPVVVYESKYRIIKFLEELNELAKKLTEKKEQASEKNYKLQITNYPVEAPQMRGQGGGKSQTNSPSASLGVSKFKIPNKINLTSVVVVRELSKMHETVYRGEIKSIIEKIKENKDEQKGEFVVIIGK